MSRSTVILRQDLTYHIDDLNNLEKPEVWIEIHRKKENTNINTDWKRGALRKEKNRKSTEGRKL